MDDVDLAQRMDERFRRLALDRQMREMDRNGNGSIHCEECGMEIPEDRRAAYPGCIRCVFCQEDYERGRLRK